MDDAKKSYSGYYKGLGGAIGGDDRFRWVNDCLLEGISGKAVLDVGCGEGSLLRMLKEKGNSVYGIDASQSGQEACRAKGVECAVVDISSEKFPLKDDSFDIVLCLETLEHLENPHHCVWEMKRVLKEGGTFIASIPGPKVSHPYIYPGLFGIKNFREFLWANGFKILKVKGWGQSPAFTKAKKWLLEKETPIARNTADVLHYIGRKRNMIMRKHSGTPLNFSHCVNFVCLNRKQEKTLAARVAENTNPSPIRSKIPS
ncbi:MAG: class I SAM-dependent methyltransferase [Candidatus Omnitrophica bacterium]|nr:class I SAM-dependent methyltransferase [Candidatus Omnitrophota bacterium]MDD5737285.1 class I SAM-dependent methyltransferase [Candidatus Omnitrophota bacterium]